VRLQPIVYTTQMDPTVEWYATVIGIDPSYRSDVWSSFAIGDASLGIHRVDTLAERGRVELSLVTGEPLEAVLLRLADHGVEATRGIQDETFGRSVVFQDPDGTPVQVNEHH
jgi:predicted enzyme related to lactoylglutathione lyase